MKAIEIVYLCVTLLPSVIYGEYADSPFEDILNELDHMANVGDKINGIFKPSPGGYLGEGDFGFAYRGLFIPNQMEVAMKFTPKEDQFEAAIEYAVYTYLNAINNTDVERYGIPSVHYFGLWDDNVLMAITLLDADCMKKAKNGQMNELDMIIIFGEFVRITKYIHGHGVRHGDIKLDNIMFRKHQGFIIDFNSATKMYGRCREANLNLLETNANEDGARFAKIDWKCFFVSMYESLCSRTDWLGVGAKKLMQARKHLEPESDADILNILKTIKTIKHNGLNKVFVEFAKHLFSDESKHLSKNEDGTPFYDQVYKVIKIEIEKFDPHGLGLVSWLHYNDKIRTVHDSTMHQIPLIENLKDPFGDDEPKYPNVDYDFFYNIYHKQNSGKMLAKSESFGRTRRTL